MRPTMCARCKKNIAVVFITRLENNSTVNEGLCLRCAKDLGIKPVDDMMQKMGLSDEDLEEAARIDGASVKALAGRYREKVVSIGAWKTPRSSGRHHH